MYKKILLASDGSKHSIKAAEQAIKMADYFQEVKIEVVFVVDHSKAKSDVLNSWDSFGVHEKRKEKMSVIEKKAKEKGVNYEVKFLRGDPAGELISYANKNDVDLFVINFSAEKTSSACCEDESAYFFYN